LKWTTVFCFWCFPGKVKKVNCVFILQMFFTFLQKWFFTFNFVFNWLFPSWTEKRCFIIKAIVVARTEIISKQIHNWKEKRERKSEKKNLFCFFLDFLIFSFVCFDVKTSLIKTPVTEWRAVWQGKICQASRPALPTLVSSGTENRSEWFWGQ